MAESEYDPEFEEGLDAPEDGFPDDGTDEMRRLLADKMDADNVAIGELATISEEEIDVVETVVPPIGLDNMARGEAEQLLGKQEEGADSVQNAFRDAIEEDKKVKAGLIAFLRALADNNRQFRLELDQIRSYLERDGLL